MSRQEESQGDGESVESGIDERELRGRVIYSLFLPAVRMARGFEIGLKEIRHWLELAYFHELRRRDLTLAEISERLGISQRKAAELSRQLKQNFFAPEREHELPRRIEFMVWAEPMSEARINQVLDDVSSEAVEEALQTLVDQGRIVEESGASSNYLLARGKSRLVEDSWVAKIDGLNEMMQTLADAVYARFFSGEPKAFARNIQFHIRPEAWSQLPELYEEHIWPKLVELDEAARSDPNAMSMELSILWSPAEFLEDVLDGWAE